jgi:hypothetical protein
MERKLQVRFQTIKRTQKQWVEFMIPNDVVLGAYGDGVCNNQKYFLMDGHEVLMYISQENSTKGWIPKYFI